jgi:8-oxo-dGTP pyrophosphatase MutT (NUDIX family)
VGEDGIAAPLLGAIVSAVPTRPNLVDLVVARAVVRRGGRVLLLRRAAWDSYPSAWELPGGKADPDESPECALKRELFEETGLRTVGQPRLEFDCVVRSPSGRTVAKYFFEVSTEGRPVLSGEHDDLVWHDPATPLPAPLTPATAAALRRY